MTAPNRDSFAALHERGVSLAKAISLLHGQGCPEWLLLFPRLLDSLRGLLLRTRFYSAHYADFSLRLRVIEKAYASLVAGTEPYANAQAMDIIRSSCELLAAMHAGHQPGRWFSPGRLFANTWIWLCLAAVVCAVMAVALSPSVLRKDPLDVRVADLKAVKAALAAYHDAHRAYPRSAGWDGLYSYFGESRDEWIKGLVPAYIEALPNDPRKDANPAHQYLYNSDGTDYKLLAHHPDDGCEKIKKKIPDMMDPRRGCMGYGFWTPGAAAW